MSETPTKNATRTAVKERSNMVKARIAAHLSQKAVAQKMKVDIRSVINWEKAHTTPHLYQIESLREAIHFTGTDEELLQVFMVESPIETPHQGERPASLQPCQTETTHDKMDSSGPHMSVVLGPARGFREFMDSARRQFLEVLAKLGLLSAFGDVSLAIVSSPTVDPEEYLALIGESVGTWWEWLNVGNYPKLERVLLKNVPVLKRLANTISPFQSMAASLAAQAKIMQIILATRDFDYINREIFCTEAVHFGQLSGNSGILATALEWQGGTYIYCYHQPQTAIPILNDALSNLDSDVPLARKDMQQRKKSIVSTPSLSRSAICIDLSVAYAQDKDENNAKENEKKARDYAELARITMPTRPELDLLYPCIHYGLSELDQLEGKMYLYLADRFPNSDYAKLACGAFEKSISKQAMNRAYLGQALIHKADAASKLGDMRESLTCLTDGFYIAVEINNVKRLNQASDVIDCMPSEWKREKSVRELQKEVSRALVVARQ